MTDDMICITHTRLRLCLPTFTARFRAFIPPHRSSRLPAFTRVRAITLRIYTRLLIPVTAFYRLLHLLTIYALRCPGLVYVRWVVGGNITTPPLADFHICGRHGCYLLPDIVAFYALVAFVVLWWIFVVITVYPTLHSTLRLLGGHSDSTYVG